MNLSSYNFSDYDANATQVAGGYLNTIDITRLVGLQVSFMINVALNIFFIVIFASDRDLDLNQMDKCLCNLIAFQDIISSVVQNATFCVFIFGQYFQINTSTCLILTSTYALFLQLSSWQLCTVVLNKFLFIKYPLRYFSMVTIKASNDRFSADWRDAVFEFDPTDTLRRLPFYKYHGLHHLWYFSTSQSNKFTVFSLLRSRSIWIIYTHRRDSPPAIRARCSSHKTGQV